MKRFHVHVNVADLEQSIRFYRTLFGGAPSVRKADYAKWMLEDPRLNFAISSTGRAPGLDHLGLQAEDAGELQDIGARLTAADAVSLTETGTTCCYATSDKVWAEDPQGLRWESFLMQGDATTYYAADAGCSTSPVCAAPAPQAAPCCGPAAKASGCCG